MRCILLLFGSTLLAQFGVDSRLVIVPVTVTDKKGRPIDGLEARDFRIYDNGRPLAAAVDTIGTGVAPIALLIAVQSSGISAPALDKVRKIGSLIGPLVTGERGCAGLLAFAADVEWLEDCTRDPDALIRAFHRLRPAEYKAARMIDAVHESVSHLRRNPNARRVLLLISESRDRGSESDIESAVAAAVAAGVAIYAAPYSAFKTAFTTSQREPPPVPGPGAQRSPPPRPPGPPTVASPMAPHGPQIDIGAAVAELAHIAKPKATDELTRRTGGASFPFTRQKALEDAIGKLGSELHTQYVLSFVPEEPVPGYHNLEVKVTRAGDFRVRARPGYWVTQ
jgi:VWFA-related protein